MFISYYISLLAFILIIFGVMNTNAKSSIEVGVFCVFADDRQATEFDRFMIEDGKEQTRFIKKFYENDKGLYLLFFEGPQRERRDFLTIKDMVILSSINACMIRSAKRKTSSIWSIFNFLQTSEDPWPTFRMKTVARLMHSVILRVPRLLTHLEFFVIGNQYGSLIAAHFCQLMKGQAPAFVALDPGYELLTKKKGGQSYIRPALAKYVLIIGNDIKHATGHTNVILTHNIEKQHFVALAYAKEHRRLQTAMMLFQAILAKKLSFIATRVKESNLHAYWAKNEKDYLGITGEWSAKWDGEVSPLKPNSENEVLVDISDDLSLKKHGHFTVYVDSQAIDTGFRNKYDK